MCSCVSMTKYFLYTGLIILIGNLLVAHGQSFYQNKTQRCNCKQGAQCNEQDGTCPRDKCASDYFGTNCQHANVRLAMSQNPSNVGSKLLDGDDSTCMTHYNGNASFEISPGVHFLTSTNLNVHFISVYIFAESPITANPTLTLYPHNTKHKFYFLTLSNNSLLIKSDRDVMYTQLELSGLPKDICSLEVSLGRNLALSSTPSGLTGLERTMDGIEDKLSPFQCADNTTWQTRLLHDARINHIIIIEDGVCQYYVELKFTTNEGVSHTVSEMKTGSSIFFSLDAIVREVNFHFTVYSPSGCVMKLFEIYIFGEFQCPKDMYGERCERHCPHGCGRHICDPDWGCPAGCRTNWMGRWCDRNCYRRYGTKCEWPCSENCNGAGDCSRDTGHCLNGCKPGFQGMKCTEPCPTGTFGADCSELCVNCKKSTILNKPECDPVTGRCVLGCEVGLTGDVCNQKEKKRGFGMMTFLLKYGLHIVGISGVNLLLVFGFIYLTRAHNENGEQSQPELYEHSQIQPAKQSTDMPHQEAHIASGEQLQLESHELSPIQSNIQQNLEPNEYTQANELSQTKLEEQSQSEQQSDIIDGDNESAV